MTRDKVTGKVCIIGDMGNQTGSYLRLCKDLSMDIVYIPAYPEMGFCLDIIDAIKAAGRKKFTTLYTRIYSKYMKKFF